MFKVNIMLLWILKTFLKIWDFFTLPIYALLYAPEDKLAKIKRQRSRIVESSENEIIIEGNPILCKTRDELKNFKTLDEVIRYIFKKHGVRKCLGYRKLIGEFHEKQSDGTLTKKLELDDKYTWLRYDEVFDMAQRFGRGLCEIGIKPKETIIFFADTRYEWMVGALGCFLQNITICTIYTNLGTDGIIYGINETDASVIITSQELVDKLQTIRQELKSIRTIIYMKHPLKRSVSNCNDFTLKSFEDILEFGSCNNLVAPIPEEEDLTFIMYTSGSTGKPKGVMLTHNNMVAMLYNCYVCPVSFFGEERYDKEAYIAYLPLAHIYEITQEFFGMILGVKIGYSSPNTLSDKSPMIKSGGKGDINILKPTSLSSVPLILERMYKALNENIASKGMGFQSFFDFCYKYRLYWINKGFDTPIMNYLIFKKLKSAFGGNIVAIISGGAHLSEDVHNFLRVCLNVKMGQGYGLTESVGGVIISDGDDLSTGGVGYPLPNVQVKIVDWKEGGYTIKDKDGPRGELVIGGPFVAKGYYKLPEQTKESFYTDIDGRRWFNTGDIGRLREDGTIQIIDRKKDLGATVELVTFCFVTHTNSILL